MRSLNHLAPLCISGPDARSFLQGQLSNDLDLLTTRQALLACCNSAQGRVQAVLHLIQRQQDIVMLLPLSLREIIASRLRKYQLRAKLSIETADSLSVSWASAEELAALHLPLPALGEHHEHQHQSVLHWPAAGTARYVVLHADTIQNEPADAEWQLADIRAGLPQVLPETHESFVAQMLNLDILGGISFNKGCYTGQEIIARAHFRGAVKRRMLRFQAECPAPLPGSKILSQNESAGEVVMAAATSSGCELLAVVSLAQHSSALTLEANGIALSALPLPYALPLI